MCDNHPIKNLTVKAQDNYGHEYDVTLEHNPRRNDWTLHILTTGGRWSMSDLESNPSRDRMAIDFGQRWYCENFAEVLANAQQALAGIVRLTAEESEREMSDLFANLINSLPPRF